MSEHFSQIDTRLDLHTEMLREVARRLRDYITVNTGHTRNSLASEVRRDVIERMVRQGRAFMHRERVPDEQLAPLLRLRCSGHMG